MVKTGEGGSGKSSGSGMVVRGLSGVSGDCDAEGCLGGGVGVLRFLGRVVSCSALQRPVIEVLLRDRFFRNALGIYDSDDFSPMWSYQWYWCRALESVLRRALCVFLLILSVLARSETL
jgi:hypothetical protein